MANEKVAESLGNHEYDGIRELDNPTPGWWHLIFLATVAYSVAYVAFWHVSPAGYTSEEAVASAQEEEYRAIFGTLGELKPDDATIMQLAGDPRMVGVGRGIFESNCTACHARDGGGINGANLCDDYYRNVRTPADLYRVISEGAANGAMPPWKNSFSPNHRVVLAAYVATLRGTRPANARAPEGEVIAPWPAAPAGNAAAGEPAEKGGAS